MYIYIFPVLSHRKNTHGVQYPKIKLMLERFEHTVTIEQIINKMIRYVCYVLNVVIDTITCYIKIAFDLLKPCTSCFPCFTYMQACSQSIKLAYMSIISVFFRYL